MTSQHGKTDRSFLRLVGDGSNPEPGASGAAPMQDPADLFRRVGARVRALRKAEKLSRRVLSERSGVSTRYLAKLEGGDSNISIGLLCRVAAALSTPLDALLRDDGPLAEETRLVSELYRRSDAATRTRVMQVLDPDRVVAQKRERICLVGLRGAGKSTLGAKIGELLAMPFVELNAEIEDQAGMPVAEIIALYGQEGYRQLEAKALEGLIAREDRLILAVGGGIVSDDDTYQQLLSRCHTIWLKAAPMEYMARVRAQGDLRPMADNPQAMIQLRQILKTREKQYALAEYHLDTSGKTWDASLDDLRELIEDHELIA